MSGTDTTYLRSCKALVAGAVAVLIAVVGVRLYHIFLGGNFYPVIAGDLYRSAQLSAADLERVVRRHGIRVVVNLRGANVEEPWYHTERETAARLGVRLVDVGMWANHPPLPEQLGLLMEALTAAEGPVLVHCNSGGDRAGLASALGMLLRGGDDLPTARRQLALQYGHNGFGMARCLGRVLDRYEEWLGCGGLTHSPARLRRWAREAYRPESCR